jgi:hypothetical protein
LTYFDIINGNEFGENGLGVVGGDGGEKINPYGA